MAIRTINAVSVSTPVAGLVELHTHVMEGEAMKMVEVEHMAIPAGEKVLLQPGGLHLMIFDLKGALKQGTSFEATLVFEKAGRSVRSRSA